MIAMITLRVPRAYHVRPLLGSLHWPPERVQDILCFDLFHDHSSPVNLVSICTSYYKSTFIVRRVFSTCWKQSVFAYHSPSAHNSPHWDTMNTWSFARKLSTELVHLQEWHSIVPVFAVNCKVVNSSLAIKHVIQ